MTLFQKGAMEMVKQKQILSSRITHHWLKTASTTLQKPDKVTKKNLSLKAVAVSFILAFLFWSTVVLTQSELRESAYTIPVDYVNVPRGLSIVGGSISELRVHLLGQRSDIQRIAESRLRARVDLSNAEAGRRNVALTNKNVTLPSGLRIIRIEPSSLELTLE